MKSPENIQTSKASLEKEKLAKSPEVEIRLEITNEELERNVAEAKKIVTQEIADILAPAQEAIGLSVRDMNISEKTRQQVNIAEKIDEQLNSIQTEANKLGDEVQSDIEAIITETPKSNENSTETIDNESAQLINQLKHLSELISQENNPDILIELKQKRVELTKEYVMIMVKDPNIAKVVCRYIEDKNATDIQALLLGGQRTADIINKIKETSKSMNTSQDDVDLIGKELSVNGSKIFINDHLDKNINPETKKAKLDEFIELRKKSPEMILGKNEILENMEGVMKIAETLLNKIKRDMEPILQDELNNIIIHCRSKGADIIGSSQRTKGVGSLIDKIKLNAGKGRDYAIGDATDLLAGRIVVNDLSSLELVMEQIEELYGKSEKILEKENKFVKNQGKDNPYRAIHYIIKSEDGNCFELQLKTEDSSISSDLHHNAVYKSYILNLNEDEKNSVEKYYWQSNYNELTKYQQKKLSNK